MILEIKDTNAKIAQAWSLEYLYFCEAGFLDDRKKKLLKYEIIYCIYYTHNCNIKQNTDESKVATLLNINFKAKHEKTKRFINVI